MNIINKSKQLEGRPPPHRLQITDSHFRDGSPEALPATLVLPPEGDGSNGGANQEGEICGLRSLCLIPLGELEACWRLYAVNANCDRGFYLRLTPTC